MSYMHIDNLYKDQRALLFKRLAALEKIHGTSAHLTWKDGSVRFFSGGAKQETFEACFGDREAVREGFRVLGHDEITVYGEAYGGKLQGMRATYGDVLRFAAFEVRIGATWLNVRNADGVARKLGLDFVPWAEIEAELEAIDAERDRPSEVARHLGLGDRPREGIVLRPLKEFVDSRGKRVIAKHKRDEFCETRDPVPLDPAKQQVFADAEAIALQWVTDERLRHVLQAITEADVAESQPIGIERMGEVIRAVVADVEREGVGIVWSHEARKAIGGAAAKLFKARLQAALRGGAA